MSTHHVRASADVTFNGDGTSWAAAASDGAPGAHKGFPVATAFTRGDTYYFAGGSYGGFSFTTANSGTTRITVKKATVADHGTATGWSAAYGTTQATFTFVGINKGYITFDGATGGGPGSWTTGFGVVVDTSAQTANTAYPAIFFGESTQATTDNCIVRHFEVIGNGGDDVANNNGQTNDGISSWSSTNLLIEYAYIHDMGRCILVNVNAGTTSNNNTMQYCYTGAYEYVWGEHSEIVSTAGDNWTFRWNIFAGAHGTGGLMFNGTGGKVYGNVFFHSTSNTTWSYSANGLIGSKDSGDDPNPVVVYNNTFYRVFADENSGGATIYGSYLTIESVAKNNLYYGQIGNGGWDDVTHDYNQYHALSGDDIAPTETNKTTEIGNPFTSAESLDFSLTANTTPGTDLGAPYDVDMFGNTRTTWTRGAIEFSSTPPTTEPTTSTVKAFGSYTIVTTIAPADTVLFLRDSDGTVKQISFGDLIASIQTNTNGAQMVTYLNADTTLTAAMGEVVVNSGATVVLTLPLASTSAGVTFPVLNKGAGHVTINPSGSDTIAGQSTITLLQYESARLTSDGSNLFSHG